MIGLFLIVSNHFFHHNCCLTNRAKTHFFNLKLYVCISEYKERYFEFCVECGMWNQHNNVVSKHENIKVGGRKKIYMTKASAEIYKS